MVVLKILFNIDLYPLEFIYEYRLYVDDTEVVIPAVMIDEIDKKERTITLRDVRKYAGEDSIIIS